MPVLSSTALNPVIGCGDSAIRVLNDNEMVYGKTLDSICTALSIIDHMSLDQNQSKLLMYGASEGEFGCIAMHEAEPKMLWSATESLMSNQSNSSVSLMSTGQLSSRADYDDVIVARDDGSLEIYSYGGDLTEPQMRYQINLQMNETITGIGCGFISK